MKTKLTLIKLKLTTNISESVDSFKKLRNKFNNVSSTDIEFYPFESLRDNCSSYSQPNKSMLKGNS